MTIKEEIVEQIDDLNEQQLLEVLNAILSVKNQRPRGEPGWLFLERTKDIHFDQDMIDAIEEEFPILRSDHDVNFDD